jgi:hypothetical protein
MHLRQQVAQPTDTSYRYIVLTQNQIAIVDAEDFEWLNQWNWYAVWSEDTQGYYAVRNRPRSEGKGPLYMHRIVSKCPAAKDCDHANENTLDNRRLNLRPSSNSQNHANMGRSKSNTSGYKGVTWHAKRRKWQAGIGVMGRFIYLGIFDRKEDAALAYNEAARKYFGEFAQLNILRLPHSS